MLGLGLPLIKNDPHSQSDIRRRQRINITAFISKNFFASCRNTLQVKVYNEKFILSRNLDVNNLKKTNR